MSTRGHTTARIVRAARFIGEPAERPDHYRGRRRRPRQTARTVTRGWITAVGALIAALITTVGA